MQHEGSFNKWLDPAVLSRVQDNAHSATPGVYENAMGGSGRPSKAHSNLYFVGFNDWIGLLHEAGREALLFAERIAAQRSEREVG